MESINSIEDSKLVLTQSGLLAFLSNIEELRDYDITVANESDGLVVIIGDSQYKLEPAFDSEVEVSDAAIEEIQDIDEEGYDDLDEAELVDIEGDDPVNGGIIKELIKTLAIGGLVRLTKNAIEKA